MDFAWPPELLALRDEAAAVGREGAARAGSCDDAWIVEPSREFAEELGRRGWLGMTWPVEEGGHGRSALERFVVAEGLLTEGAPVAACWFADRQIGPTLLAYGTDAQRRRFLPGIVAGTDSWCIGLSEPDAGSDLASLRTSARRDGDDFVVTGHKVWTSGATSAAWCYLVCRTDPDAPAHRGLSELVVDMASAGIDVRTITDMTGNDHFCEVTFDEVRVPADHLVGRPNESFRQVMRQLEHERGGIDRLVSNRRLVLDHLHLADTDDPLVRQDLARLEAGYVMGRLLVLREVLGQAPPSFSAATKAFCTEYEQQAAGFVARIAGPGAMVWGRVARGVCYAPAYTIMGGTSQILRNIVGERVLGLPR